MPSLIILSGFQTISDNDITQHTGLLRLEGQWLTLANGTRIERSLLKEVRLKADPANEYYRNKPSPISFFITLISFMALYAMLRADNPQQWPLGQATLPMGIAGLAIGTGLIIRSIKASRATLTNLILPEDASDIVLLQTTDRQWASEVLARCTLNPDVDSWLIDNKHKTISDIT